MSQNNKVDEHAVRSCILTTSYPRDAADDAGIFVKRMVDALSAAGVRGTIIVPFDGAEPVQEMQGGFCVKRYRYGFFTRGRLAFGSGIIPNLRKNPLLAFQIPLLLIMMIRSALRERGACEIMHANWIPASMAAWAAHLVSGIPYIVTLRGEDVRLIQNPLARLIFRLPLRAAAAVVSVNESFLPAIEKSANLDPARLRCIPNGVSVAKVEAAGLADFTARFNLDVNKRYILFVGTIVPRKRIHVLVDLLRQEKMENFELLLCGRTDDTAYCEKIHALVAKEGVAGRVHFFGKVAPRDIPYFFSLSRYYVSASEFEGRSNSLLEALAAGMAVIATDIPGHTEVLRHGENGLVFGLDTIADAAAHIHALELAPERRAALQKAAANSMLPLSWQVNSRNYMELLRSHISKSANNI